jgi:hypothetical protein
MGTTDGRRSRFRASHPVACRPAREAADLAPAIEQRATGIGAFVWSGVPALTMRVPNGVRRLCVAAVLGWRTYLPEMDSAAATAPHSASVGSPRPCARIVPSRRVTNAWTSSPSGIPSERWKAPTFV